MKGKQIILKGIVNAADWDEAGRATRVAILTNDDEEYLVADNEMGRELLDFESQEVKATGVINETEDGEKMITVSSYEAIEYDSSDDERGEEDFWD